MTKPPPNNFDPVRYLHHFDDCTISKAEKIELIEALWLVAQSFADNAFGMTPKLPIQPTQQHKTGNKAAASDMIQTDIDIRTPDCAANDNAPIPENTKGRARA